ncbi:MULTISPECIES: LPD1 domain-containing protein [unclassified Aureispira]|uniref:LPD1 domain-containing protein n=1 Tax=unclassified Aureispira TaxID=2649989 RepID=UPI0006981B04|nr:MULTISPECIES: LPD1 domain-containing protein [unclassified Aureispira]WMX15271.1 LPD1 domain-containing protein [Aureispira sp. CCB-E]
MAIKITDTLGGADTGVSKMEAWWRGKGFQAIYKEFRKGSLPAVFLHKIKDVRNVQKVFNLRGFQFGNWVSNEDRFNYLAGLGICLYDLNKVLKFKANNLGLDGTLGVAFGARGQRGAVAHYEPSTHIINMTRYYEATRYKNPKSKAVRFVNSGGVGSFAHEYGHFLDYFFGSLVEPHNRYYSLSNGSSTNSTRIPYNKKTYPIRSAMEDILEVAYWNANKTESSTFIKRIKAFSNRSYYVERTEILARLFEQYIAYKLKRLGVANSYLTKTKYTREVYMTPTELKKVVPLFDQLFILMRTKF